MPKPIIVPTHWIRSSQHHPLTPDRRLVAIHCAVRLSGLDQEVGAQETKYVAMLDTGADRNWIDRPIATALGLPAGAPVAVSLTGVSSSQTSAIGRICVRAASHHEGELVVGDFRSAGCAWDVLLGMDFLQHYSFSVNGPSNRSTLTYFGQNRRGS